MEILYLHGLNSSLQADRRKVLEKHAIIHAPLIDYPNEPNAFKNLLKNYQNVRAIIGSSAGGLVAYYLAQKLNKPCLIFNPALTHKHALPFSVEPFSPKYTQFMLIVMGLKDEIIPTTNSLSEVLHDLHSETNAEIHLINKMEHSYPIEVFEREFLFFLQRIL